MLHSFDVICKVFKFIKFRSNFHIASLLLTDLSQLHTKKLL